MNIRKYFSGKTSKILLFTILLLCISLTGYSDCYFLGAWFDTEEIISNCISSVFPGETLCCMIGCGIPVLLSPLIPDYHLMIYPADIFHGMGWKLPFGITILDSGYEWYPGLYILHPRTMLTGEYEGFEFFNALRLEFLPEIIFSNSIDDILYGIAGRLYIPITAFVSLHAEGGFLISDQLFIPHAGGGLSVYINLSDLSDTTLLYIQAAPKIMFLPENEIAVDIQVSIKFVLF